MQRSQLARLPISRSLGTVVLGTNWLSASTVQLPVVVSSRFWLDGGRIPELAEIDNARNKSSNDDDSDGNNPFQSLRLSA